MSSVVSALTPSSCAKVIVSSCSLLFDPTERNVTSTGTVSSAKFPAPNAFAKTLMTSYCKCILLFTRNSIFHSNLLCCMSHTHIIFGAASTRRLFGRTTCPIIGTKLIDSAPPDNTASE